MNRAITIPILVFIFLCACACHQSKISEQDLNGLWNVRDVIINGATIDKDTLSYLFTFDSNSVFRLVVYNQRKADWVTLEGQWRVLHRNGISTVNISGVDNRLPQNLVISPLSFHDHPDGTKQVHEILVSSPDFKAVIHW